jgi:hypothetical protein
MESLKRLIPFLNEEELNDLLIKILSSKEKCYKDTELKDLLPFLKSESIDNLFIDSLKKGEEVNYFLPFVSHETLKNIVELYCANKLDYEIDVNKLALYLDKDDIALLYKYLSR